MPRRTPSQRGPSVASKSQYLLQCRKTIEFQQDERCGRQLSHSLFITQVVAGNFQCHCRGQRSSFQVGTRRAARSVVSTGASS